MTTYTITETDLQNAVEQLMLSGRGQTAMKQLVKWLDEAGLGLDADNQDAVLLLLQAAWGEFPGTARDLMRDATRPRKRRLIAREMSPAIAPTTDVPLHYRSAMG